jgi:hypothetical protein
LGGEKEQPQFVVASNQLRIVDELKYQFVESYINIFSGGQLTSDDLEVKNKLKLLHDSFVNLSKLFNKKNGVTGELIVMMAILSGACSGHFKETISFIEQIIPDFHPADNKNFLFAVNQVRELLISLNIYRQETN